MTAAAGRLLGRRQQRRRRLRERLEQRRTLSAARPAAPSRRPDARRASDAGGSDAATPPTGPVVGRAGRPDHPGDGARGHLQRHGLARQQGRRRDPPGRAAGRRRAGRRDHRGDHRDRRRRRDVVRPDGGPGAELEVRRSDVRRWRQVGVLRSSNRGSEDVTTQVIDTGVRVRAQEASLKRVELLLAEASDLKDVIWIESQLTSRQAELDSLKSQQSWLTDQTSLSTITVDISAPARSSRRSPRRSAGRLPRRARRRHRRPWARCSSPSPRSVGALLPFAVAGRWCSGCRSGSSYAAAGAPRRGRRPRRRADASGMTRPTPAAPGVGRDVRPRVLTQRQPVCTLRPGRARARAPASGLRRCRARGRGSRAGTARRPARSPRPPRCSPRPTTGSRRRG